MFIIIAACLTFLVVFILLWPIRKIASLLKSVIVISIPALVCAYLWLNGFLEVPQSFHEDNQKLAQEIDHLKEKVTKESFNMANILELNELYLQAGELDHSLNFLKSEIDENPKQTLLQLKLAETIVYSDNGVVSDDTKAIFQNLKNSKNVETQRLAEFYLGLYKAQQGDLYDALKDWQTIVKRSHADDRWLMLVVPAIKKISNDLNLDAKNEIPKPKPPRQLK